MGVPIISTPEDFRLYVSGVQNRKEYENPAAFAIGAVRYNEAGKVIEAIFPKVNQNENFGSVAAFADVAHYRNGNAVYEMVFWDFKALDQLFEPFLNDLESHPNVAAYVQIRTLMASPHNMKPVIVFVGDIDGPPATHPVYDVFMRTLVLFKTTGDEKHLHYKAE